MKIVVTGSAGFIGNALAFRLLQDGHDVIGIDSLTPYYDVELKKARLARLTQRPGYVDYRSDLNDADTIGGIFAEHGPVRVAHMAAQPGVRESVRSPRLYIDSNIGGFLSILEACRRHQVEHLVYASTSSVYGGNRRLPSSEHAGADHPLNLYAATKRANELMAHSYSHVFGLPTTGLRFFTVYGPWPRPDMALLKFATAIAERRPIELHNEGKMQRDFTYIDDIVEGIVRVLDRAPEIDPDWSAEDPDPASSGLGPFRIYNIGNNDSVPLTRYVSALETAMGVEAEKILVPIGAGELEATWAAVDDLARDFGYRPKTSVEDGVARFVEWFRDYYNFKP
jgi:UDP-glucuronate 4-epimerase